MDIQYFNRHTQKIEREKVYGDKAVKWLYQSALGKVMGDFIATPFVSEVYGMMQDSFWSQKKIPGFIEEFDIEMDDFLPAQKSLKSHGYGSFNEFFIRRFKPGARQFCQDSNEMPAFCEARYFGHKKIDNSVTIPVKGAYLQSRQLLANSKWNSLFEEGPFLVARLCPVDYHRFHFPDDGQVIERYPVHGALHSVNPIALKQRDNIFITNKREVSILETQNFGLLAFIEVGATCVGKIVQSYPQKSFSRGDEKGYFLFGGSTVVVLGQKGAWTPVDEVLDYTQKGIEVYSKLGACIARA